MGKKLFNFLFILLEQRSTLPFEFRFNLVQLSGVVGPHIRKLFFHTANQIIDMVVHELHLLDVVLVLLLDSFLELVLQLFLIRDDVLTLDNLFLDVLVELLAVFLLFEFLPVPVNFNVFLVGSDDFVLDLIGTLALLLFFLNTALVLNVIGVSFDRSDRLVCLAANLLQESYSHEVNGFWVVGYLLLHQFCYCHNWEP
jgi:hypothetical protein